MGRFLIMTLAACAACGQVVENQPVDAAQQQRDARDIDATLVDAAIVNPLTNPSFEQDYTGWVLEEDSGNPTTGVWGIAADTDIFVAGQIVHDFTDNVDHSPSCFNIPTQAVDTFDGGKAAFNSQTGPERHLLSQFVTIPAGATKLTWRMQYENTGSFDLASQFLAVEIRDPSLNTITATLFTTDPAAMPPPPINQIMTQHEVDISAHAGQSVKLTVDLQVQLNCWFLVVDDFVIR